jgi:hypothetical protein
MTMDETGSRHDRANFVRIANRRVPQAIKALELIGNLSNRSNYAYTENDVKAIMNQLKTALNEVELQFAGKETKADVFRLE